VTEAPCAGADFHSRALEQRYTLSSEWHARSGLAMRSETNLDQSRQEFADFLPQARPESASR
jgi:hypothetical protein